MLRCTICFREYQPYAKRGREKREAELNVIRCVFPARRSPHYDNRGVRAKQLELKQGRFEYRKALKGHAAVRDS